MRVLWDFRLFSHGYGNRGVGNYTIAVAAAIQKSMLTTELYIWGDRKAVPLDFHGSAVTWIDYHGGNWKKTLMQLPWIVIKHKIELVHYWVALGPVSAIGMGLFIPCKTVATVYDPGVELWDVPYNEFVRKTPYWRVQKLLFTMVDGVITISHSAQKELQRMVALPRHRVVVYPPLSVCSPAPPAASNRTKQFLTLAGSPHKNCRRVVDAFVLFRKNNPDFTLCILGAIDKAAESLEQLPKGVVHLSAMDTYKDKLIGAAALVYCSLHEGLGLPPLEAMQCATPLILSDIPVLRETGGGYACFVDPCSVEQIAQGMEVVAKQPAVWSERSRQGAQAYVGRSMHAGEVGEAFYRHVAAKTKRTTDIRSPL